MKPMEHKIRKTWLALSAAAFAFASAPASAVVIHLCAKQGTATMPDGEVIPIWGYVPGNCLDGGGNLPTLPSATGRAPAGLNLTVVLHNDLPVPTSLFIPGMPKRPFDQPVPQKTTDGQGRERLTSFDDVAPPGGIQVYSWKLKPGTYIYQSGTDVRTQVPMGLYGALVVESGPNEAYPGVSYDSDRVLVFSEVDPSLNKGWQLHGGARVTKWTPKYFLINGKSHPDTTPILVNAGDDVLFRFVNVGLQTFVPTWEGGVYMDILAEDGNPLPMSYQQYGLNLPAAKTIDAMVNTDPGTYAIYDRSLHLTTGDSLGGGMLTYVHAPTPPPDAPLAAAEGDPGQ